MDVAVAPTDMAAGIDAAGVAPSGIDIVGVAAAATGVAAAATGVAAAANGVAGGSGIAVAN